MSMFKKIISIVLSVVLCFSASIMCSATGGLEKELIDENIITLSDISYAKETIFTNLEAILINTPEALGFNSQEVSEISLGEGFTISNVTGNTVSEVKDIMYFPIISDNNVIALITLIKYNGELSASIGKDFAKSLSSYLQNTQTSFSLFAFNQNIYAIDTNSHIEGIFNSKEVSNDVDEIISNISFSKVSKSNNTLSCSLFENASIIDLKTNNVELQQARSYKFLDYPIVFQGSLPVCWAATVAAMVMHEIKSMPELTATEVCDAINHSYTGGSAQDIIRALKYYLPSIYAPTYYSRAMTKAEVQTIINNIDPACMLSHDVNSSNRHATSLCGYSISGSTFNIRIMDSAYECFKFSTYSSAHGFRFAFGNTQYEWDSTVRLLYNL